MKTKTDRNMDFTIEVDALMSQIRRACIRKVVADHSGKQHEADFKVTKRQVADSLDHLPTSIRSTMVAYCQSHFKAIHEA